MSPKSRALHDPQSVSHILPWICLVLVASTAAYGLHLTAAALLPSADAAPVVASDARTRQVLLVAVDPVTGDHAEVQCEVPSYSFTSNVHLVDGNAFPSLAQTCNAPTATFTVPPHPTESQPRSVPGTFGAIGNNPMRSAMEQRAEGVSP